MASEVTGFEKPTSVKSLAMIRSRTVVGVSAIPVVVEVHLANGLPSFSTVGLPETAVKESKDRVRGAILNSGFEFPAKRITVNLAPADLPKTGGRFDLPIAIGILIASGQLNNVDVSSFEMVGELALDGHLRKVSGVLPTALSCGSCARELVVPYENTLEASLAANTTTWQADHLLAVCQHLAGKGDMQRCVANEPSNSLTYNYPDLSDVKGQERGKRALEIAASGEHSLLLIGPPGTGKSMLASRLPGILPQLSLNEALETAAIQSVAEGEFNEHQWLQRPFRSPHHSASAAALAGGGAYPRPGEISLAHNGILFLDELPEFSRSALEQLREPLETGRVHIARARYSVQYPANFQLVSACNPCKCGFLDDGTERCRCSPTDVEKYRSKISGPMLDRIDMHLHLPRINIQALQRKELHKETSETIKARVVQARLIQHKRQNKPNNQLSVNELECHCELSNEHLSFLASVCEKLSMSARAYHRILKLARTIADMAGANVIEKKHLSEAISFRSLDRK